MNRQHARFMIAFLPVLLLTVIVSGTIARGQPATPTPYPSIPTLYVGETATMYVLPYNTAEQVGTTFNMNANITGVTPDYAWFRIQYMGTTPAWLRAEDITFTGDLSLRIMDYPPPDFYSAMQSPTAPFHAPTFTPTPFDWTPFPTPTNLPLTPTTLRPTLHPSPTAAGNVRVEFVPLLSANSYTDEHLNATARVLHTRLQFFGMYDMLVQIKDNDVIIAEFMDNTRLLDFVASTQSEGHIAFIDLSQQSLEDRQNLIGTTTITDSHMSRLQTRFAEANGLPTLVPTPVTTIPNTYNAYTGLPYETILTNDHIHSAYAIYTPGSGSQTEEWGVQIALTQQGQDLFTAYAEANAGRLIGITIDNLLIAARLIESPTSTINIYNEMSPFTEQQARQFASMAVSGGLLVPLGLQDVILLD